MADLILRGSGLFRAFRVDSRFDLSQPFESQDRAALVMGLWSAAAEESPAHLGVPVQGGGLSLARFIAVFIVWLTSGLLSKSCASLRQAHWAASSRGLLNGRPAWLYVLPSLLLSWHHASSLLLSFLQVLSWMSPIFHEPKPLKTEAALLAQTSQPRKQPHQFSLARCPC